jgi:hypothetical protein
MEDSNIASEQGSGGNQFATGSTVVDIQNAADLAITAPATSTGNEDTTQVFSGANIITVDDGIAGDGPMRVTLSVANGTLTLADQTGITFVAGADGSSTMVIEGLQSDLNTALDGLIFAPTANYNGGDTLSITTAVAADLAGHYTFEGGNADDQAAGTANNGTLQNGASIVTDGERGQVLSLDGVDDSVRIAGLFGQPESATLAAWINLDSAATNEDEILSIGNSVVLRYAHNTDELKFFIKTSSGFVGIDTGISLATDTWHHVAGSVDDATGDLTVYINGESVGTTNAANPIIYNSGVDTYIGRNGASTTL